MKFEKRTIEIKKIVEKNSFVKINCVFIVLSKEERECEKEMNQSNEKHLETFDFLYNFDIFLSIFLSPICSCLNDFIACRSVIRSPTDSQPIFDDRVPDRYKESSFSSRSNISASKSKT